MVTYTRKTVLIFIDMLLFNISVYAALLTRFEYSIPPNYLNVFVHSCIILTFINICLYYIFGLYRSLWKYASIIELIEIFIATFVGTGISYLLGLILDMFYPRSVYFIIWLLSFILLGGIRFGYRILRRAKAGLFSIWGKENSRKRVMVIGAGAAGSIVIKEMKFHRDLYSDPIVVIDDDKWKHRFRIHGVPVAGGCDKIKQLAETYKIDEIIIAIPSAERHRISEIAKICSETRCRLKTLPGVYELINEKVGIKSIRDVSIEDLLGRDEIKVNLDEISEYLKNEVVLVTGGGGSIGSELCRHIARFEPKKLLIFDIYENSAYDIQNELLRTFSKINLEVIIGSVREIDKLKQVFSKYRPGVVFHAAAHKHVPLMELNPEEAVKNNVLGTLNTAKCADEFGAKKFVLISTDKAVNPTNIMGATKRVAEMIVQSLDKHSKTEFVAVRFGNVLGSNGSVIPLFKKQIEQGGPVTVTHPDIIRYFMTIPEAVQLVIQAGAMAKGGEIFILDMGEPVRIADLARDLIKLSGLEPDIDIRIEYTGLRPGEKLYEELLLKEEGIQKTRHEMIFVGKPVELSFNEVLLCIKALENSMKDAKSLRECMASVVNTYHCNYEPVDMDMKESAI